MREVLGTGLTVFLSAVLYLLLIQILARGLGPEEFGAYALARRWAATIVAFTVLAMDVALVRYLALERSQAAKDQYFASGLILGLLPSVAVFGLGFAFRDSLASLLFASSGRTTLFLGVLLMVLGYAILYLLYSCLRGLGEIRKANLWLLVLNAAGPLLLAGGYLWLVPISRRAEGVVFLLAAWLFVAAFPLGEDLLAALRRQRSSLALKKPLGELARYGIPRVPGAVAWAGLLMVGPLVASRFESLKAAGYLVAAQAVLRLGEAGLKAFELVAVPRVARLFSEGQQEFLANRINDTLALVFHLGIYATLHLLLWSDVVVLSWLGGQYAPAIPVLRVIALALLPYLLFVMLRGILDAIEDQALNSVSLLLGLGTAAGLSLLFAVSGLGVVGIAVGTTIGFAVLGISTVHFVRKFYPFQREMLLLRQGLLANAGLCLAVFVVREVAAAAAELTPLANLALAVAVEAVAFSGFLLLLRRGNLRALAVLEQRLFRNEYPVTR